MKLSKRGRLCMKKNNPKVECVAMQWLKYSNKDLADAAHLTSTRPTSSALICWLCQQTVEKAIKSSLVLEKIHFPRTHDLNILLDMLPEDWTVKNEYTDLSELTNWTVSARYPSDWPEPTYEDVTSANRLARSVYDLTVTDFERRGIRV